MSLKAVNQSPSKPEILDIWKDFYSAKTSQVIESSDCFADVLCFGLEPDELLSFVLICLKSFSKAIILNSEFTGPQIWR